MRLLAVLLAATCCILSFSCSDNSVGSGGGAVGALVLNVPGHPPEITVLRGLLTRVPPETIRTTIALPVPSSPVVGTIANVPAGGWRLVLEGVAPNGIVLYTGSDSLSVPADSSLAATVVFNQLLGTIDLVFGAGPSDCAPPAAGMVAWWPGQDSPYDAAGDNNGVPGWPGLSYGPGKVGKAFVFDGVSGQVRVPDAPALAITGSLTIEGWINAAGYPEGRASGQILFRGDDRIGIDPYFLTMLPDGRLLFHVASTSAATNLQTALPVGLGTWHHVAGVLNDATDSMAIYLDGVPAAGTVTSVRPYRDLDPASNPGVGIGNTQSADLYHDQPFHGVIDELSVYSSALTAGQVAAIFNAGSDGKCGPKPPPPPDSLTVTTFAEGFDQPAGLVFSQGGQLLVANFRDPGVINALSSTGVVSVFSSGGGRSVAALARDAAGYIYGTCQDGTVKRIAPGGGAQVTYIDGLGNPAGIAIHTDGTIYVVDASVAAVKVYSAAGTPITTITNNLVEPVGVSIAPNGIVYVADRGANRISRIDSMGIVSTFVSGVPSPHDMTFDGAGRLFVSGGTTPQGENVFIVTPAGNILPIPHEFGVPVGVALNGAGNLFVSNYGAGTVSKVVFPH